MSFLDRKGEYYEGDMAPNDIPCQKKPSPNHVLKIDPLSVPMACWREKTVAEDDAEIDVESERAFNLSIRDKILLEQIFKLRKVNEPSLTPAIFLAELKSRYKVLKQV